MTEDIAELVERTAQRIAEGNNGGAWAKHYTNNQKQLWRRRAQN